MNVAPAPGIYEATAEYLVSLKARGPKLGLERMAVFAEALGHPELAVPVVHVAGTNGKGSVSAMLEAVFRAAGWRTGLYTSPHLVKLGERVQVNREILSEAEIVSYTQELRPVAERLVAIDPDNEPSFFEFMTAMAFLQFARRKCDIAIIEVGLGGRLDATNVVQPEVSAITSIGMDHCEYLGDDLEKIAWEKAGIIKPGRPVVMGRMPREAEAKIRAVAQERGSRLISVAQEFGEDISSYPATNLEGDYQRWNAATARLVAQLLPARWRLGDAAIAGGLSRVDWPGRWQRIRIGGRQVILDASHNPEGASVLETNLTRLVATTSQRPVIITGVLGVARARPLLQTIARHAAAIYLVVPQQARASSQEELAALIPPEFKGPVYKSSVGELFPDRNRCTAGRPDEMVVVTGSIYLLGEVMARLAPERGAGEGRLQDF